MADEDTPEGVFIMSFALRLRRPGALEPPEERSLPPPMPTESISAAVSATNDHLADEPQVEDHDPARGAGVAAAEASFGAGAAHAGGQSGGKRAVVRDRRQWCR